MLENWTYRRGVGKGTRPSILRPAYRRSFNSVFKEFIMKRHLTLGIVLSLLAVVGIEVVAQAYSLQSPHDAVVVFACKGDKDDDCSN